jgi:hypothetical protein
MMQDMIMKRPRHPAAGAMLLFCGFVPAALFPNAVAATTSAVLGNAHILVEINCDTTSTLFGGVSAFVNKDKAGYGVHAKWFDLHAGEYFASARTVLSRSADSVLVRLRGFGSIPLTADMLYYVRDNSLILECKAWVSDTADFPGGLEFDMQTEYTDVSTCSQGLAGEHYTLRTLTPRQNHLNSNVTFYNAIDSVTFLFRNPFHSVWELNANGTGKHSLKVLQTLRPRGRPGYQWIKRPDFSPRISPSDTIFRRVEVHTGSGPATPLYLCEHPNGYTRTLAMFWDELPNRDNWAFMTTAGATDVKYDHYFVRLMNEHPALKMGYILLVDRMLYRANASFDKWSVNSPYIFPDSLEPPEGKWCVGMTAEFKTPLTIYQTVHCEPLTDYRLTYLMKTYNVKDYGAFGQVYGSHNDLLIADEHQCASTDWMRRIVPFTTGAQDTSVTVYLRIQDATGTALFDDAFLGKAGTTVNLLQNPGFEINVPQFLYANKRRHWVDAHGPEYLVNKAPRSYLDFLKRIENGDSIYGWEKRVRIGCHGYHHSPALCQPDPDWEFEYYDPDGDLLRIQSIFRDVQTIGLTRKSLRFIRTPGFSYTASILNLLIDSGFVFLDPGLDLFPSADREFSCMILTRGAHRMCAAECSFWADCSNNEDVAWINAPLAHGHLCLIGSHPEALFLSGTEASYQRFNGIITACERNYSNLGYVFPDEYADNAVSVYGLRVIEATSNGSSARFVFKGAPRKGNSVLWEGTCQSATFDGAAVDSRVDNGRTYFILPAAADTIHVLLLENALRWRPAQQSHQALVRPPEMIVKNGVLRMRFVQETAASIDIYDLRGRKVYGSAPGRVPAGGAVLIGLRTLGVASGDYLYRVTFGGTILQSSFFLQ